ncbi:MAG: aminomethyl-transferring glycine dehydrogenase [Planctomycetota bacterium]
MTSHSASSADPAASAAPARWAPAGDAFAPADAFLDRHLGPRPRDAAAMLARLGVGSLAELLDQTVPAAIRSQRPLELPPPAPDERALLEELQALMDENQVLTPCLGLGYHGTITPPVLQRQVLENPGWYTQYTPYQAEISQGRLEAMLNFQTMVMDLTGMEVANSSLLDEGTAAAEAMTLCLRAQRKVKAQRFLVAQDCHPQTIAVVQGRAEPLGIEVVVADPLAHDLDATPVFGVLLQYPGTDGRIVDYAPLVSRAHAAGALVCFAADLLALTLLRPPGELGADVVLGSSQRFGVPLGYGGPHAAFMAVRDAHKRQLPGRVVGVSVDAHGKPALRLALQTREQHIRREKATSNICTAQVLLAVVASSYAIYHGPDGLLRIARRVRALTCALAAALQAQGCGVAAGPWFDTLRVTPPRGLDAAHVLEAAVKRRINLRAYPGGDVGVALDETSTPADLAAIVESFGGKADSIRVAEPAPLPAPHARQSAFLKHPVFNRYHSETELLRYLKRLEARDLSLTTSMIPLGSCTMKLNATVEMLPLTWEKVGGLHPFAPPAQAKGYAKLFARLEAWLAEATGFAGCSLQPNAGSQGEYAGLLVIRAYHRARGDSARDVCLIPTSAHGTNPASAVLAGMRVVTVACDEHGNVDLADLRAKAEKHQDTLAALMITYPSTHGVFEEQVREVCAVVHAHGGQVYLDGANMNAMVGVARPGEIGADVCHLNLHKTFCIPHGGGGPGMGPICVAAHLAPYLPGHPLVPCGGEQAIPPVSAAPWGSPSILTIPYAFVALMGGAGLRKATEVAILNANYIAERLDEHFPVLFRGARGRVAHECILDLRPLKDATGITADDVAKRLMDYGFHAPTMHFPVAGTLMIEPTESESLEELERFCAAMIAIRGEIAAVAEGRWPLADNPLVNAPHTAASLLVSEWSHAYTREEAAYPAPWLREHKFWPAVGRIDNAHGDRHLICACPPLEAYGAAE